MVCGTHEVTLAKMALMSGGLLWYGHKCMKGGDDIVDDELYHGTSKSMEGQLADECYNQAKEEGCKELERLEKTQKNSKDANAASPVASVSEYAAIVVRWHRKPLRVITLAQPNP